jgi:hypothetical protein
LFVVHEKGLRGFGGIVIGGIVGLDMLCRLTQTI